MDSQVLFNKLIGTDVIQPAEEEGMFELTNKFDEHLQQFRQETDNMEKAGLKEVTQEILGNGSSMKCLSESEYRYFVETYRALTEFVEGLHQNEAFRFVSIMDYFQRGVPPSGGAPSSFVPVHGDRLNLLLQLYDRVIIYIWRENCNPCDIVRQDFEDIFDSPSEELALLAVHGPESASFLYEEFDVGGAPTTLFAVDGRIDSRLLGSVRREAMLEEIDIIRNAQT